MNRREAISRVALIMGGTLVGAEYFLSGCKPSSSLNVSDLFKKEQLAFIEQVADTILPDTKTPGAKAAKVGNFMAVMVRDCYEPRDQQLFMEGIDKLNAESNQKNGKDFMKASAAERTSLLTDLDKEQRAYTKARTGDQPPHYFRLMKELSLLAYFTSEIGCTQALRYLPVPGKYDGSMPYKKGDKAWAT
jgi:hypothetical protein